MTPHTSLGDGGEFDIIRRMLDRWGPRAAGIGDDAAVVSQGVDGALVVSTDTSVENVHFRNDWLSPTEIGYRATASALSDLAAVAAKPVGVLVAMGIPDNWRMDIDQLCDGIGEAASLVDAPIIGGDLSRAAELSLTITVLGTSKSVLLRSGAKPGDFIYVTGRLGGSKAALDALLNGKPLDASTRMRFAHPVPRIAEALWLAERGATAAIDISDGLAADAAHIAAASRVRLNIEVDAIPAFGDVSGQDAAQSGEEYELVVTSPAEFDVNAFTQKFYTDLTMIGRAEPGEGVAFSSKGKEISIGKGYLHFQ